MEHGNELIKVMGSGKDGQQLVKSAHNEHVYAENKNLNDIYIDHADLARRAHEKSASEFSGNKINVDANKANTYHPDENNKTLNEYDVVSNSEGLNDTASYSGYYVNAAPISNPETVIVKSAGNYGDEERRAADHATPFDTQRNSLRVGQVTKDEKGNITLDSITPTDGVSFSVESAYKNNYTQNLIHLPDTQELQQNKEAVKNFLRENILDEYISDTKEIERTDERYEKYLNEKTEHYINNPNELNNKVISSYNKDYGYNIDKDGNGSGLSGTSFCSPVVAGYLSGAINEQKQLAQDGKTSLTNSEVVMTAYLSTTPVTKRENSPDIKYGENSRGLNNSNEAGYGFLDKDKFKENLGYAQKSKEQGKTNQIGTYNSEQFKQDKDGTKFEVTVNGQEKNNTFKLVFSTESNQIEIEQRIKNSSLSKSFPITIISPSGTKVETTIDMESSIDGKHYFDTDKFIGEDLNGKWQIITNDQGTYPLTNVKMTAHTYEKGGFIDDLVDKKSKEDASLGIAQKNELQNQVETAREKSLTTNSKKDSKKYEKGLNYIEDNEIAKKELNDLEKMFSQDRAITVDKKTEKIFKNELEEAYSAIKSLKKAFNEAKDLGYSVDSKDYLELQQKADKYKTTTDTIFKR